jgi:hypothetical protein
MKKLKTRKKINKVEVMRQVYKPQGDFLMEKLDAWTYKLHFTSRDAARSISALMNKFDVEDAGKGYHGSAYIVRHKLA